MSTRRFAMDEWFALVAARKAELGAVTPRVKRTLPRDPEKTEALVALAVARMRTRFPELYEVVGDRRFRLRPARPRR